MTDAIVRELIGDRPLEIIDIGARPIAGHDPCYRPLVDDGLARLTAFDPDPEACASLRSLYAEARIVEAAVGDGAPHPLYRTEMASKSSLFPPNDTVTSLYQTFAAGMAVEDKSRVETVRLDDALDRTRPDFITMDIQGGEAMAIAGGQRSFGGALIVETEVEFVEQYRGQPLFGDIDCALRALGFAFHQFTGYATRAMRPVVIGDDPTTGVNQWLWADAVYMADPVRWHTLPPPRLRALAALMHEAYDSWDIAYAALLQADRRDGGDSAAPYLAELRGEVPQPAFAP